MKKIAKIVSFVLVFAMLTLALASCGATAEERVAAAMAKMAMAKKMDCTVEMDISVTAEGETTNVPMAMVMKSDMSDAENPVCYMEIIQSTEQSSASDTKVITFYKDGYVYMAMGDYKYKQAMDYKEMEDATSTGFDITGIFEAKKEGDIGKFDITKNEDGTLDVEMTITAEEFETKFSDFTDQIMSTSGLTGTLEVSDTVFKFTVDKENNITDVSTTMNMELTYQGVKATLSYKMDFKYNPVSADYEVPLPTDLDKYISIN